MQENILYERIELRFGYEVLEVDICGGERIDFPFYLIIPIDFLYYMGDDMPRAYIYLLGGNERYSAENVLFRRMIEHAGDEDARVVIIPTASSQPESTADFFRRFFRKLGASYVGVLWILSEKDTSNREYLRELEDATCIFFTGGDQERIVKVIRKSEVHDVLLNKLDDDIVIGGTSAGAMALADICIVDSRNMGLEQGDVEWEYGLDLVHGVIIDTHFIERNRFWRLSQMVSRFPENVGIGIAEDTGVIYDTHRREFEVIGSSYVTVIEPPNYVRFIGNKIEGREYRISILADGAIFKVGRSSKVFF